MSTTHYYRPSSSEIQKFKKNGELSNAFLEYCKNFMEKINDDYDYYIEILEDMDDITYTDEQIKFYSYNDPYYEFSPYYDIQINYTKISFISVEQFVDFAKALYSNDKNTAFKILIQSKSHYCHNYAKNINETMEWKDNELLINYIANDCKFKDEKLKNILLETKGKNLIFNNIYDNYYGMGKKEKGENMLGKILMTVRNNINQ